MFGQRSVAGLAVYVGVAAVFLFFQNVGVAGFASQMAGEVDGTGSKFRQRIPAIVSVLPKTARNKKTANSQKGNKTDHEDGCDPEKVACVFQNAHRETAPSLGSGYGSGY